MEEWNQEKTSLEVLDRTKFQGIGINLHATGRRLWTMYLWLGGGRQGSEEVGGAPVYQACDLNLCLVFDDKTLCDRPAYH